MKNAAKLKNLVSIFLIICLLTPLAYFSQTEVEKAKKTHAAAEDILYITPGRYLKPLVLGYDVAVADLIWLRAIQYVGEKKPSEGTYKWFYPLADTVTDLDPTFDVVYDSAGVILSVYATPKRIDESIAILKKGVENNPVEWRHSFYLSFIYFHYKNDFQTAAKYMAMAAACPHHPPFTEKLAARLYAEAKHPEDGILFLSKVIESTRDEKVKQELEQRLVDLVAERDMMHLEKAVGVYVQKAGKRPTALSDLVASGIVSQLPKEPGGGHYYLDAEGNVMSSRMKERLRIHGKEQK